MYFSIAWGLFCGRICYLFIVNSVIFTSWKAVLSKNRSLFWSFVILRWHRTLLNILWGKWFCSAFNFVAWEIDIICYLFSMHLNPPLLWTLKFDIFRFLMRTEFPGYMKCRILIGWYFEYWSACSPLYCSSILLVRHFQWNKKPPQLLASWLVENFK